MSGDETDFRGFEVKLGVNQPSFPGKIGIDKKLERYGLRRKLEDGDDSESSRKASKVDTEMTRKKGTRSDTTDETMTVEDDTENNQKQKNDEPGKESKKKKTESKTNKNSTRDNWIMNTTHTVFFIERMDQTQKPIHVMEIAKILHNIGIKNYKELKFAGQGRYRISFNRAREAEDLINSKLLADEFHYKVYVPNMLKQSIGVVRNIPPSLTDTEIQANICAGKKKVDKVERISRMRDNVLIPTYTIKIYVNGQDLPQFISIYGVNAKVEDYIFPIKICNRCWRYGHRKTACKSKNARCENCGLEHEELVCQNMTQCIHCKQAHKVTDKNCPERIRQDKIRFIMANEKLTFTEAANRFPRPNLAQNRLNSLTDFPPLLSDDTNNNSAKIKPNTQTSQDLSSVPDTIQKIVQQVKEQLIKQFDVAAIINKITGIQKTIIKHAETHKNSKDPIDSDILLIKISDQIKSIIEPEVNTETLNLPGTSWTGTGI